MNHYAEWTEIQKVHPQDQYELKCIYSKMLGACPDLEYIALADFLKCCNSIYILVDKVYGNILGIIAIRLTDVEEATLEGLKYYCLDSKVLYKVEAFHCDGYVADNKFSELVNTAIADKNDGFIYYKPICPVAKEIEKLETFAGFREVFITASNGKTNTIYLKNPATYGESSPERQIEEVTELA